MILERFLELFSCAVDMLIIRIIPVIRVPPDKEPDYLGPIKLLFVNLENKNKNIKDT